MFKRSEALQFYQMVGGKSLVDDVRACERALQQHERRFAVRRKSNLPWHGVGAVREAQTYERGVRLACERGWVEVEWLAHDVLRVRFNPNSGDFSPPFSYAVEKTDWLPVDFSIEQREDSLELRSVGLVCRIGRRPFRLVLETPAGKRVCLDTRGMQWRDDGSVRLSMGLHPDESSYGLGERAAGLNLRGKHLKLWNTDPGSKAFQRDTDPLYISIPFYLGVHELAYGVFWDNSSRGMVDVGAATANELVFEGEGGELRYVLFASADANSVLSRFTELTGRIKLPPMWFLGYQQSRFSYGSQDELLHIASEFRRRNIPCDVLHLDIHHMDDFRVFTWDKARFPRPMEMTRWLHEQGFKVINILDPGVKVDAQYPVYVEGITRDVFVKDPDGQPVSGAVWAGTSHFPDFSNPATRDWWGGYFASLLQNGVDGVWNDMCEPPLFSVAGNPTTLPDYTLHDVEGRGGTHMEQHNVYGLLMARAAHEALERLMPERRAVVATRSGFAGMQRYTASWLGDNSSDWDHLRLSISMALNMGLSGAPMTGPDIGGFHKEGNGELFTRWLQAAVLMPLFRTHTSINTATQEPWSFGQPFEVINRLTIQLRYRLLPYLYSVIAQCREYGWPVLRPLFMAEPTNLALRPIDDAYLVGDALLVAPVVQPGAIKREVYLPTGDWYDFWTNERYRGGQNITVPAPLERLPLFVRGGAVLPLWPEMQYVGERTLDSFTLRVYPGSAENILYEDAGEGRQYEDGDYRWVYVTTDWDDAQLVISRRTAGRFRPPYTTLKVEVVGLGDAPADVRIDRRGAPLWFYDDDLLEVTTDDQFMRMEITRPIRHDDATIARRFW